MADGDLAKLRRELQTTLENYRKNPASIPSQGEFIAATAEYLVTGLELYLAAAAEDRESAKQDRASAADNRASAKAEREADLQAAKAEKEKQEEGWRQQEADRKTMNRLTQWIMVAAIGSTVAATVAAIGTIAGVLRKTPAHEARVTVSPSSAPVVNMAPMAPIPVTLIPPVPAPRLRELDVHK